MHSTGSGTLASQPSSWEESWDLEALYQEPAWLASLTDMLRRCMLLWERQKVACKKEEQVERVLVLITCRDM